MSEAWQVLSLLLAGAAAGAALALAVAVPALLRRVGRDTRRLGGEVAALRSAVERPPVPPFVHAEPLPRAGEAPDRPAAPVLLLTPVVAATLAGPLVRVVSLSAGVRRALAPDARARIRRRMRTEVDAARAARLRAERRAERRLARADEQRRRAAARLDG